jgi:hydroxylaminobenzene mutase
MSSWRTTVEFDPTCGSPGSLVACQKAWLCFEMACSSETANLNARLTARDVTTLARQSQRLLQFGVGLLLFASFEGFVIPYVAAPRLGLSTHTLSGLQAVLLLALGLAWTRINLGDVASRLAFWLLVYSTFAILAGYVLGAFWGAGNETMPMAAGAAHAPPFRKASSKSSRIHRRRPASSHLR